MCKSSCYSLDPSQMNHAAFQASLFYKVVRLTRCVTWTLLSVLSAASSSPLQVLAPAQVFSASPQLVLTVNRYKIMLVLYDGINPYLPIAEPGNKGILRKYNTEKDSWSTRNKIEI